MSEFICQIKVIRTTIEKMQETVNNWIRKWRIIDKIRVINVHIITPNLVVIIYEEKLPKKKRVKNGVKN